METNYTLEQLSKLLVQIGKRDKGSDLAYPWAMGTLIGLVDFNMSYKNEELQNAINRKYIEAAKELSNAH
jgi:hypothetical protein